MTSVKKVSAEGFFESTFLRSLVEPMDRSFKRRMLTGLLLTLLLVMINPPTGVLSSNEENYFGLAELTIRGEAAAETSSLFDTSDYRFLPEFIIGTLINAVGFEYAQQVGSILNSSLWAIALVSLFAILGLSAAASLLSLIFYFYLGPDLFGTEWLFYGSEAKTLAYPFTVLSLSAGLTGRLKLMAILAVASTYLHFQVGGYWFVFAIAAMLLHDRSFKRLIVPAGVYLLLVAPQIAVVAQSQLGGGDPSWQGPSLDWIQSIYRAPHHTYPFRWKGDFVFNWLPGICVATLLVALRLWSARWGLFRSQPRIVVLILDTAMVALSFTLLGIILTGISSGGFFGKFYLFRPTSLALLLIIAASLAAVHHTVGPRINSIFLAALIIISPQFVIVSLGETLLADAVYKKRVAPLTAKIDALTQPGDVVIIDIKIERDFLDLERKTGVHTYARLKFDPTGAKALRVWYSRIQEQNELLADPCSGALTVADYILVNENRAESYAPLKCLSRHDLGGGFLLFQIH